jgi:hypothetical protein
MFSNFLRFFLRTVFLLGASCGYFVVAGQKKNAGFQLHIKKLIGSIKVDGNDNDAAWEQTDRASDFYMVLPMDTSHAKVRTDVRMTYDDERIYLLAVCYTAGEGSYMVESLRRDFAFLKNDNFLLFMDPFDDQLNGFSFGSNAAGAQWDGIIYDGGKVDLSWDNKWTSVVKNYADRWVFEAAIPFKSIRFKKGITEWGINFGRLDLKTTEKSSWTPVPRQFPTASLAYTGTLIWDAPPPEVKANVSIIPYALTGLSKNYEQHTPNKFQKDFGADAKVAITSSLNLDLTVNPDFSQVDVDRQVTNLDRFELFFPEKRQFFLENGDVFANFGYANIRPFFSRRIGLNAPIQFGARLSGKLDKNWRIGVMDMQTSAVDDQYLPMQNFAVVSLQRKVFARSSVGVLFTNKQSINYTPSSDPAKPVYNAYNRNVGLEYNLASPNNVWTGKTTVLKSFTPNIKGREITQATNLNYTSRKLALQWQHEYVGKNFNAEMGYVPRKGYIKINPQAGYLFFPKGTQILSHGPLVYSTHYYSESFKETDNETLVAYKLTLRSQATLQAWASHNFVQLLTPFDPTNLGTDTLTRGTKHIWNAIGVDYVSEPQKLFTKTLSVRYGGYYANGTRLLINAEAGFRFQPYVSILMAANYNDIHLPKPWGNKSFWLVGPRIDVTMTNTLYFTAFCQYNEQAKNINLNTRLQWRYQPASDLFIVYTDNYLPENFGVKTRALVLKFTYWWGL